MFSLSVCERVFDEATQSVWKPESLCADFHLLVAQSSCDTLRIYVVHSLNHISLSDKRMELDQEE